MASSAPNKSLTARASAVLTTGEVAATRLDLNESYGSQVCVDISFTLGMLTNVTLRYFVSMDGVTYVPFDITGGAVVSTVYTADGTRSVWVNAPGWKFFRVSAQGSGTVTSSLLALTYRYLRRGSQ